MHPLESGGVECPNATHGQLAQVGFEGGSVADRGEEFVEAAGEGWGDEEGTVQGAELEADSGAVTDKVVDEGLVGGGGGEGWRVGGVG